MLTYHNNLTQTFIFAQKWSFVRLSSSYHVSMHKIVYQKIKKLSFFLKVWWDVVHQIWWDVAHQIWWVKFDKIARIKFDESLSSSLMSRFVKLLSLRKIGLDLVCHLEKIRVEQSKHKRWDDQAWSRKRIHRNTFCKKKNLKSYFSITSHTSKQNAKHVISIFITSRVFREKHF
jgi:hypothetical protein